MYVHTPHTHTPTHPHTHTHVIVCVCVRACVRVCLHVFMGSLRDPAGFENLLLVVENSLLVGVMHYSFSVADFLPDGSLSAYTQQTSGEDNEIVYPSPLVSLFRFLSFNLPARAHFRLCGTESSPEQQCVVNASYKHTLIRVHLRFLYA